MSMFALPIQISVGLLLTIFVCILMYQFETWLEACAKDWRYKHIDKAKQDKAARERIQYSLDVISKELKNRHL